MLIKCCFLCLDTDSVVDIKNVKVIKMWNIKFIVTVFLKHAYENEQTRMKKSWEVYSGENRFLKIQLFRE